MQEFESSTGLDRNLTNEPSYTAEGLGVAGEIGSYLIPTGKVAKGAGIVKRILFAAKTGAKVGALMGATTPEDLSLQERLKKTF